MEYLGADFHFENISKGIIDSRDIVYFLSVCLSACTAHILFYKKNIKENSNGSKEPIWKLCQILIYLVVVVLINVAGITLFFRLDLTENNVYSISEASKQVVSTLSEPLTINVFFTKNLPAPHNHTEQYLHDLLHEYAIYANQHFNYRFYDVSPEEGGIDQSAKEKTRNWPKTMALILFKFK